MSEPKMISPLLDGFTIGHCISDHDGIACYPAIKENTEKKYILKVITIPATQAQLDAMILAGAYKDPSDAMAYYERVGEDVMREAELLNELSKLDGFLAYDGWQMEPITKKRLGYQVYLVGSYKRTLEKHFRRNPVTHLDAVNLGLDLCSALNICRQAGAIYVDLKPSNIFVSGKKEYRIGDLGLLQLDSLHYSTLPSKYHSPYTPPEAMDPMVPLNTTLDSYAVGMILYQLYNDGQLPKRPASSEEPIVNPLNADYELAEIILKAIDPDPDKRWQDPSELGKALASYMQRNSVNDVPVTPHTPLDVNPEDIVPVSGSSNRIHKEDSAPLSEAETTANDVKEAVENSDIPSDSTPCPSAEEASDAETIQAADETVPSEEDANSLLPHEMSDELSRMISKADDLISHETPEGVVVPEIPEAPDPFAFAAEDSEEVDDSDVPRDPVMPDPEEEKPKRERKKKFASQKGKKLLKKFLSTLAILLSLTVAGMAAFAYYQFVYLQTIDAILIEGDMTQMVVSVETDIEPSLLTVVCSDHFGNTETAALVNGKAVFSDLNSNTMYTVELEIDGFHKLIGQTSDIYTTDATTNIVSFNAITGTEDGAVILNFTADGEEPDKWMLRYQAEGEKEAFKLFSGHSVTIDDLSVGKLYTFTLDAGDSLTLSGNHTLEFLASRVVLAKDLILTSSGNDDLTVHWKAPGDIMVDSWDVRCYNDAGYDKTLTVNDPSVYLTGIDFTTANTIEVTASGMTHPSRTSITANPIRVDSLNVISNRDDSLTVSWKFEGDAPDKGWLLLYSMDGGKTQTVVKSKSSSAKVTPRIPDAKYQFTIQSQDGISVLNNIQTYTCPSAESFKAHGISAAEIESALVKTPNEPSWRYEKLEAGSVTDQFRVGENISLVLHGTKDFYQPGAVDIDILFVIRDAYGNVLPDMITEEQHQWKKIWEAGDYHYAELDLPLVPRTPGDYTLSVYFNGYSVAELPFHLSK